MKQTDLAWAAGFLDGEGSVRIRRLPGAMAGRPTFYGLSLSASQVEREPLDKLRGLFGGSIHLQQPSPRQSANASPYYNWMVTGRTAAAAIRVLLPYFTVKRERAVLGLEFQSHIRTRTGRISIRPEELALREMYFEKMRILNLRLMARRTAAETKSEDSLSPTTRSDSPVCKDDKFAEDVRNVRPLSIVRTA